MNKGYTITQLPIYNEDYIGNKDIIARNINYKGELTTLSVTETNYIAMVNFVVGKEPRGNHYHNNKKEYLYICKGKVKLYLKNRMDNTKKVDIIEVNEGSLIFFEPGVSHAVEAIEDGFGIEFSSTQFDLIKNDNHIDIITENN